jgi:hypothetical protein
MDMLRANVAGSHSIHKLRGECKDFNRERYHQRHGKGSLASI